MDEDLREWKDSLRVFLLEEHYAPSSQYRIFLHVYHRISCGEVRADHASTCRVHLKVCRIIVEKGLAQAQRKRSKQRS